MAKFAKIAFSAQTDGTAVSVAATATPGTLVHTTPQVSSQFDEVWLYAASTGTSTLLLYVEFGGTATVNQIRANVAANSGLLLVVPGLILGAGLDVRAWCSSANTIRLSGYVNRITA